MLELGSHKDNPEHVDDDDDDKDVEKVDKEEGEDDAPLGGGGRVKRHKASKSSKPKRGSSSKHLAKDSTTYVSKQQQQQEWDARVEEIVIDEDEATLNDVLSNQFKNAKDYAYHLEQTTNFMENQIVWKSRQEDIRQLENTEEKKYILSLHKIHAERFPKVDLEEKINRWVRKEFKTFNEDARLSIQHWKDSWRKRVYKQNQRRVRNNPEDYFSNHMITEVVRITTNQPHSLDFMEQIIMMREIDKSDSFFEADFKYLNKNDIEDLYYLCRNKLGIQSYQIKVNLTAPTLTFPGIKAHEPYFIIDKPSSLIYLNNKNEKRVMYLTKIMKFCDATLEKVLKERNNQATKSPRANEKMEIYCEWKTNSIDDVIINP
nr:hypothetical protein [Tanacetum cinerariifolium]